MHRSKRQVPLSEVYVVDTRTAKKVPRLLLALPRLSDRLRRLATRLLALVLEQIPLANADRLRRDFDQLVVGDEFHGVFKRELDRWRQRDGFVLAGSTDIGQLLALDRVDDE